jgi:hypothetical protein
LLKALTCQLNGLTGRHDREAAATSTAARPYDGQPNPDLAFLGDLCAELCALVHGDNGLILLPNLTPFI